MKQSNIMILAMYAITSIQTVFAQTTSFSDVVGYEKKSFVAGTTGHGVGLVQAASYQGQATSVTSDSIGVSSAPFTAGAFAPVDGLPSHYIQITSGSQLGLVVDILSNTASTLTVEAGDLASVSGTPNFVVRPHVKVSTLFNGNTDLGDYSDTVTIYNSDGSSTTLLRDSAQTTGWLDSTTFSASDAVIYPGQGFLLSTSSGGTFTNTGVVNPTSTIVPIYSGLVNLVSLSNPSSGKDIQQINLGANLSDYADTVGTFSTDGQLQQDASLLWTVADGFLDATTFSPATGVTAGGTSAMIVNASGNTTWIQPSPLSQ
jgi:hypothetical protein